MTEHEVVSAKPRENGTSESVGARDRLRCPNNLWTEPINSPVLASQRTEEPDQTVLYQPYTSTTTRRGNTDPC